MFLQLVAVGVLWPLAHAAGPGGARLDGTRLDAVALLFLFVVVLVLCVVSSCLEDAAEDAAEDERDSHRAYHLAEERESPAASPRPPRRARERSPIWRTLRAEQARLQDAAL